MLDHISEGRLNFGVAASGLPRDWAMFNVDGMSGVNREMTREALDIILRLWAAEEPFHYEGKYWKVDRPDEMFGVLRPHIKPLQDPHPPIGVAGLSKSSDTLKLAGERGFLPMSLNLNPAYVASHWDSVEAGRRVSGRTPWRGDWRLVREVFVAETDEAAGSLSVESMMGRMMREYFLPLLSNFGFLEYLKHDPDVADSDVDAGVLRPAQLAHRLAGDGGREAGAGLRRLRRLRPDPGLRLRLLREAGAVAGVAGPACRSRCCRKSSTCSPEPVAVTTAS